MNLPVCQTLKLEVPDPGLLVVTLDRQELRNALNTQMGRELRELFVPLKFTPGELRCIVITGAGDKAFCSGGDLKERQGMSDDAWRLQHAIFEEGYYAVMDCAVPVIAAVNGPAYAGGCELALACDFIFASSEAKFALTEVAIGIMPGGGGTQNMPRAMGERRAKQLILTGLRMGHGERGARPGRTDECDPVHRAAHCSERADLGAAGEALDPHRYADGPLLGPGI